MSTSCVHVSTSHLNPCMCLVLGCTSRLHACKSRALASADHLHTSTAECTHAGAACRLAQDVSTHAEARADLHKPSAQMHGLPASLQERCARMQSRRQVLLPL